MWPIYIYIYIYIKFSSTFFLVIVHLGFAYFAKTEIFFVKNIVNKDKNYIKYNSEIYE